MKIVTSQTIKNLKGESFKIEGEELTLGLVIAEALASSKEGGKMKMYLLAEACYKNPEVTVDAADLSLIKKSVEASQVYNTIITGQALSLLEEVK